MENKLFHMFLKYVNIKNKKNESQDIRYVYLDFLLIGKSIIFFIEESCRGDLNVFSPWQIDGEKRGCFIL